MAEAGVVALEEGTQRPEHQRLRAHGRWGRVLHGTGAQGGHSAMIQTTQGRSPQRESVRRVALASMVGTSIEWYDFFIFGTASALVFGGLFFPTFSELAGTLAAFASFAVGFVARPVGGLVFGHIGDRRGRKTTLVLTLTMMGLATFAMGLMPSYAAIGVWAPILMVVLRFVQGLAVGGEWGGAVLMATEHSGGERRGLLRQLRADRQRRRRVDVHGHFSADAAAPRGRLRVVGLARAVPLQHRAGARWPVHPAADHGVTGLCAAQRGPPSREGAGGGVAAIPKPATCCWPPGCTWRMACCSTR